MKKSSILLASVMAGLLVIIPLGAYATTTIEYWNDMGIGEKWANTEVIEMFQKENPGIKVNDSYVPDSFGTQVSQKLLTAIAAGIPPDVAWFDRFAVGSWAAEGALTDLSALVERDNVKGSDYFDFAWREANYLGKTYGLPTDTDARFLFFNKGHFREIGLDPNSPPETIEELEEVAAALTIYAGRDKFERLGFAPWVADDDWLYLWAWVFGGRFYDPIAKRITLTDPGVVNATKWLLKYTNDIGGAEVLQDFVANPRALAGGEVQNAFLSEQVSMDVNGNWFIYDLVTFAPDIDWGISFTPHPPGVAPTTWSGGFAVVIPRGAKNVEAAWQFAKYYGYGPGNKHYAVGIKNIPTLKAAAQEALKDPNYGTAAMKFIMSVMPNSHNRPVLPTANLLQNTIVAITDVMLYEEGGIEETLKKANEEMNAKLATYPGFE